MAETETKKTEKEREDARNSQLNLLGDSGLKGLVIANAGRNSQLYGELGKQSTHNIYLETLSNPTELVSKMIVNTILAAEQKSGELYGGAFIPAELLNMTRNFYFGGLDGIKVSDILNLMETNVSDEVISKDQKVMYMEDYKSVNEDFYKTLKGVFAEYTETTGVGESITQSGKDLAGNLEKILSQKESNEPLPKAA